MSISEAFRDMIRDASEDDAAMLREEIAKYSGETIDTDADRVRYFITG